MKITNQPAALDAFPRHSPAAKPFSLWLNQHSPQADSYYTEHLDQLQKSELHFQSNFPKKEYQYPTHEHEVNLNDPGELALSEPKVPARQMPEAAQTEETPFSRIIYLENDLRELIDNCFKQESRGFTFNSFRFETSTKKEILAPSLSTSSISKRYLDQFQLFIEDGEVQLAIGLPEELLPQTREISRQIRQLISSKGLLLKKLVINGVIQ
ncbi:hypothetical protein Lqui_2848 [Legionella quinlivanii]|uniref:Uncharacterized protein n=1 Tax=Legionella quinlivanii TaxID=45073 RepID=A0A0W0XL29_9GAMM|nr:hypothetical protein [Legionella quinlivanii]KTD45377.1 hypothetical protein Lqui_2848 [Legionella quinlivanii]SEG14565.1 hypothetical protein SAMN02746093_01982 [Legionella quinlivanii DSM 21216]STY10367.1 Uncharacterised protein [Legionella quinlivanii]